ncbi:MAG: hypothetical protein ACR2IE_09950 [Candidatus Sumerlaeaceae bacterium]
MNLVQNNSFEETSKTGGEPNHWSGYAPHGGVKFSSDSTLAHEGTHSATIETTSDQIGVLVSNAIPVAPGEPLKLSVWMRAPDISTSSGGMLSLSAGFQDRYGSYFKWSRHRFPPPENRGDWFLVEREITIPDRAATMTFQAGMRFITGKMWIDDAKLITSHSAVIRFDVPNNTFEPGATSLPMVLITRAPHKLPFTVKTEPGGATKQIRGNSVTLPFTFKKRGRVIAKVSLSPAKEDGGADFATSITGQVPQVLTTEPLLPTHWVVEDKETPSFEARFWIAEPAKSRAGFSARCELLDETSKTIATWKSKGPLSDTTTFKMSAPKKVDAPTTYTARLTLERGGKAVASAEMPWRFIHADDTQVSLADDGYLRVHGKRFFPIGMYMSGTHPDIKQGSGFNVVQSYNAFAVEQGERPNNNAIQQFLDRAYEQGFKALVFVNHGLATRLGREESLRRIRMFRNHPASLVWYEEEAVARGLKPLSWLAELVEDMRRQGPGRPVLLGDLIDYGVKVKDRSNMLPADLMDIGIWWWYPTPPRNAPVVEDYEGENAGPALEYVPPSYLTQAKTKKPLWIALQSYKKPDAADARFPTPEEYRCQAYLSIVCGAKGLYYYTGYGEQGNGILSKPEEGHWKELKALVRELRSMEDVFMAPDAKEQTTCYEPMISIRTKQLSDGKRVLLAVNRCNRTLTADFTVPAMGADKPATVRFENRNVQAAAEGQMKDEFRPYAVHVYEIP